MEHIKDVIKLSHNIPLTEDKQTDRVGEQMKTGKEVDYPSH